MGSSVSDDNPLPAPPAASRRTPTASRYANAGSARVHVGTRGQGTSTRTADNATVNARDTPSSATSTRLPIKPSTRPSTVAPANGASRRSVTTEQDSPQPTDR